MHVRLFILAALFALASCSDPPPHVAPSFINKVWSVTDSTTVAPGTLYVFLSEGTLVITSSHSTPMTGKWSKTDEGLTMAEEGLSYRVDVLRLTDSEFRIRSHNPGKPVDIGMKVAPAP